MARRRGFRRGQFGKRRTTDWEKFPVPAGVQVAAGGGVSLISSIVLGEGALHKPTITRIRGRLRVFHETFPTAGIQSWGAGIMLLTDAEVAAVALPGPMTDLDEDRWIWLAHGWLHSAPANTVGGTGVSGDASEIVDVDSKAMRVWEENFTLAFVVENLDHTATASTINATFAGRVLLKLA